MAIFSIVIPVYNNASFLDKAIRSLELQTFSDWEAIVVVDASPDNAAEIIKRWADRDARIKPIIKSQNQGTHLARKTGVENCSSRLTIFLDADDELTSDALTLLYQNFQESECDILHFGTEVFGENVDSNLQNYIVEHCNTSFTEFRGEEIPKSSFVYTDPFRQDWRILQRVYKTSLLKEAFSISTDERLGRGQDSYEWLIIASLADTEIFKNDLVCYRYYLGRGITNQSALTVDNFVNYAATYQSLINAALNYARKFARYDLMPCVQGMQDKLIATLTDDWIKRVADDDKVKAAYACIPILGPNIVAEEMTRIARDNAYELWDKKKPYSGLEPFNEWIRAAEKIMANESLISARYVQFSQSVTSHINDLKTREMQRQRERNIFQLMISNFFKKTKENS